MGPTRLIFPGKLIVIRPALSIGKALQTLPRVQLILPLALFLSACGGSGSHQQGMEALTSGNHDEAVASLTQALKENPGDWKLGRDLGIALYYQRDYPQAVIRLESALRSQPDDAASLYHLGASYESLGKRDAAIETYSGFTRNTDNEDYRDEIQDRIENLTWHRTTEILRQDLEREMKLSTLKDPPERTVAMTPIRVAGIDDVHHSLAAALGDWMIADLTKVTRLTVVERLKMDVILTELALAESSLVDPATAPRVGRLLGARQLVGGSLQGKETGEFQIELALTEVTTSDVHRGIEESGNLDQFYQVQKDLIFAVLDVMEIELTAHERAQIEIPATRDLTAALAYGEGILAERRGSIAEAKASYRKALEADSKFELARQALEDLPPEISNVPEFFFDDVFDVPTEVVPEIIVVDRLDETNRLTGGTFWPMEPDQQPNAPTVEEISPPPPPPPEP